MDGEERGGDEAGGEAEAEDGDTDGVELEDDPEVEAEVGQVEHRGGETGQRHAQPDEYDEYLNTIRTHQHTPASKGTKF